MMENNPKDAVPMAGVNRRGMLRGTGASAVAVTALAAAGLAATTEPAAAQAVNDAAILNFALNLEYLEAEFYLYATTGAGLGAADTTGLGNRGTVVSGANPRPRQVTFATDAIRQYANEITKDELAHVRFLRAGLGGQTYAEPTIDLSNSFATLGRAIGVPTFDPFADENQFLLGAYIFEDVGVTAYHGAAPLIQNKQLLSYAAGILAIEAYHASLVRTNLFARGFGPQTQAISNVRASLSGVADDMGVVFNGTSNIALSDSNAIAFSRTTRQVLNIVYGTQNATGGGFFPNGMNGVINR